MTNDEYYLPDGKSEQVTLAFTLWVIDKKWHWDSFTGWFNYKGEQKSTIELYKLWLKDKAR